jgi:membrane protease subunit (stomatin/prohibitin family)
MGLLESITGKVTSDLEYKAGGAISKGIKTSVKKSIKAEKISDKCPKCKKPIVDQKQQFCPECGTRLFIMCTVCGKRNAVGSKCCSGCGDKLG